jgi:hypothetical protein
MSIDSLFDGSNAHLLKNDCADIEQQLANTTKQIVMLRDALQSLVSAKAVKYSTGRTPEYEQMRIIAWGKATQALAATNDLSGYILCDAEPVGKVTGDRQAGMFITTTHGTMLYKAKEPCVIA